VVDSVKRWNHVLLKFTITPFTSRPQHPQICLSPHLPHIDGSFSVKVDEIHDQPGWSEVDPLELWRQCQGVIRGALKQAGLTARDVASLGIACQRNSFVTWRRSTGQPLHRIVNWQDTRAEDICNR
jgi:glycerol kinase